MATGLSYASRRAYLDDLADRVVDLVVIGGGITGAGMALDAVRRGLSVVVVEKGDFSNGASSKSSKLLHGGLRYLQQAEFKLVFESLAQRNRLFDDVPHLARKLDFLFPTFRGGVDKGWMLNVGLTVYDILSAISDREATEWHQRLSTDASLAAEPALKRATLKSSYRYMDGLTEDSRLVIETLKSAVAEGAIALNYAEVASFDKDEAGTIRGLAIRDGLTGRSHTLRARRVFNATGPWVDAIRRLDDPSCKRRLRPTKGVHLLTEAFVRDHAVVMRPVGEDEKAKRVVFVIPWGGRTLIGTTDTDHQGDPDDFTYLDRDVEASPEEVRYLLDAVNASFDVNLTERDVISAFAGWRPLVAPGDEQVSESAISREYEIFTAPSGLISIAGGKLTAFRTMAKHAVDVVVEALRGEEPGRTFAASTIETTRLSGSELGSLDWKRYQAEALADTYQLPKALLATLVSRYGTNWTILRNMVVADARLGDRLTGLDEALAFYAVEAVYAVEHEGAVSLQDFLMRRTRLYLLDTRQALEAADGAARLMAGALARLAGWDEDAAQEWVQREVGAYRAVVAHHRAVRDGEGPEARRSVG